MLDLPAIDMSLPEAEIIPQVMEQLEGLGFLHLKNVEDFDEDATLAACKAFHGLPAEAKHSLKWKNHNPDNKNIYRGLAPFVDNDASHKELFDMGLPYHLVSEDERKYPLHEETPFPAGYPELKQFYEEQYMHRLRLGLKLASYIAIGLGKERNFFESWFKEDSLGTYRSIFYLPRSKSTVKND